MAKIRVVVVDDHTLIRQGMVGLLASQPDLEIVGQAGNGQEALRAVEQLAPDVVLMDITMPGISGLSATSEIKVRWPAVQVLILTMHDREDYLYQALRAGASGYVLKGADVQDLLAAVRSAYQGQIYLYPGATKALVAEYLRRADSGEARDSYDRLSDREREILHLIAQGRTTPEIATELFLSPHTVQSHRDHLMAKLNLHSKAQLIKYAITKGLIELYSELARRGRARRPPERGQAEAGGPGRANLPGSRRGSYGGGAASGDGPNEGRHRAALNGASVSSARGRETGPCRSSVLVSEPMPPRNRPPPNGPNPLTASGAGARWPSRSPAATLGAFAVRSPAAWIRARPPFAPTGHGPLDARCPRVRWPTASAPRCCRPGARGPAR